MKFSDVEPEHIYFSKNFYEEVKNLYEKTKGVLEEVFQSRSESATIEKAKTSFQFPQNTVDARPNEELRMKISKQKAISITIQRAIERIRSEHVRQTSPIYFTQKLKLLNDHWARFTLANEDIMATMEQVDDEYLEKFECLESLYEETVIQLQEQLEQINSTTHTPFPREEGQETSSKVNLPRINIPIFGGDHLKWQSFKDLFTELIHKDKRIAPSEKLFYLKTSVTGEPSELIKHLQVTNENYKIAWDVLNKRFNNKRLLVATQLRALLNQPCLTKESSDGLKKLHDTTNECLLALTNMGIEVSQWDPMLLFLLTQKLDKETHRLYEQSLTNPREVQTLGNFLEFLENRFQGLEALTTPKTNSLQDPSKRLTKIFHGHITPRCPICEKEHKIYSCEKLAQLKPQQRTEMVRKMKLCENCLVKGHSTKDCKNWNRCKLCNKRHHTLLHWNTVNSKPQSLSLRNNSTEQSGSNTETQSTITTHLANNAQGTKVLLPTAVVKVVDKSGYEIELRALVDQGSQATFITEDAAQRLRLTRRNIHARVSGIGTSSAGTVQAYVDLTIKPRFPSEFKLSTKGFILRKLTKLLPTNEIHSKPWDDTRDLCLADPNFSTPGKIDLILGAEVVGKIILNDVLRERHDAPVAQNTELGWILSGEVNTSRDYRVSCFISEIDIHNDLRKFWELEEVNQDRVTTSEDAACENHFRATHQRLVHGRYTVRLPFREDPEKAENLEGSRELALARLFQMERKFKTNKTFEIMYRDFMTEYLRLGHMVLATDNIGKLHYLPHHAVLKEESTTTKLRVVFDASAKRNTNRSLNDIMMVGPQLQQNLASILIRWRKHKIVFTADIEKMYRQINIDVRDQNYQRILWRESPSKPIQEYKLTTVTYGTASAPYLAIRTLHQLALDDEHLYPVASKILLNDAYVDDIVSGVNSLNEAEEATEQLIELLKGGGFNLRKWSSNSKTLLKKIPKELHETVHEFDADQDKELKTLGVLWNPRTDTFKIKVSIDRNSQPDTKRKVLSEAAKIFDPIGLLAPVTIKIKLLFQEIWKQGANWDMILPETLMNEWMRIKEELPTLERIEIPRWMRYTSDDSAPQLHGFSDASEKAYSAAVYLRTTVNGNVRTMLVTAKTKVAPLKGTLTLPRLELCGAALVATLLHETRKSLDIDNLDCYAWTDSTIVLSWIREDAHKWKTFVGNRVAHIQSIIDSSRWSYVKSTENPADVASRGIYPATLRNNNLWWEGPHWLKSLERKQISKNQSSSDNETQVDIERRKIVAHICNHETRDTYHQLLLKYSSLEKLQRITAYCTRFLTNIRLSKQQRTRGPLTTEEIENALIPYIRLTQERNFTEEICQLSKGLPLQKKSRLSALCPFLDNERLLRVGGRTENANLKFSQRHPVILPYTSELTALVIHQAHKKALHGGNSLTLEVVRQQYWIMSGPKAIKKYIHQCVKCHRHKAQMSKQLMGMLPSTRITPSPPFSHTGVDYAGPFDLLLSRGRGMKTHKGYISLFICLSTKAVHIEVVTDLTSQAFIAAFRRFVSRRGPIAHVYSDNATNFVGASKVLRDLFQQDTYKTEVNNSLQELGTQWHFIPPASPHFGGLWEAGIKSIKHHMKRVIGDTKLTYEEMCTLMSQIEACLNSRPLCSLTEDPESLEVLTPGHFLIGAPLLTVPDRNLLDTNPNLLNKWHQLEKMHQEFWKRWSVEYVARLQYRPKWARREVDIKIGDLVLIKDEQLPPARWSLGRIKEIHPGKDGLTRVVTLRTRNSDLKRPITKISLLPITDNNQSNLSSTNEEQSSSSDSEETSMYIAL